jgi:hypothetical protein
MSDKRVTYLIGAGASANALPVVNGMNDRMELFVEFLKTASSILKLDESPAYRIDEHSFDKIDRLLVEIKFQYTIDTYAKRLFLLEEYDKLEDLKRFLSAYLIFEQLNLKTEFGKNVINTITKKYLEQPNDETIKKTNLLLKLIENVDYRYDSMFANLLSYETKKINPNINFVSWNYDNQFEIAYSNYRKERYSIDEIQNELQILPSLDENIHNIHNSAIIKLNGTSGLYDSSKLYGVLFDFSKHIMDEGSLKIFIVSLLSHTNKFNNTIKFAWENDTQINVARTNAKKLIGKSDIIVVVGYSFPTFNREVDREIFKEFNNSRLYRTYTDITEGKVVTKNMQNKKIYIQDTPQNAPKIKERLKAIGGNLFDVAEIYDDVDQFFIPPEL